MRRRSVYRTTGTKPQVGMCRHGSRTPQYGAKAVYVDSSRTKQAAFFSHLPPSLPFFSPDVTFLIVRLPPPLS